MIFPIILIVLSVVTHFAFFGWPAQIVFDEIYNGAFASDYTKGTFYFDVHPPLAKLLVKFFSDIIGAPYNVDYLAIGNDLPWGVVLLRLLPVITGVLLPVVVYFICRHLNFSKLLAFAAGLLIIFENSLLVQSRFILFDSILIFFGFTAILLYLIYVQKGGRWFLLGSALLCAGAFSIKWTGLAFPLIIVIAEILRLKKVKESLKFIGWYALVGLIVYLSVFAVHFAYLNKSGKGDAFMTDRFQKTLVGNIHENDQIEPKKFFGKFFEINVTMYEANKTLTKAHPYSSMWSTWPLMIRPIFYWEGTQEYIYLIGNPLIYWGGFAAIIVLMCFAVIKRSRDKILWFILGGFLVNYIPFVFIGRVMFLYHYEAALVFSIIALCYCLDRRLREKDKLPLVTAILILAFILFIFFAPLTYGLHLSDSALQARMWLPTWR